MTCVLNGADGWASFPWDNPDWNDRPPIDHVWLTSDAGAFKMVPGPQWPGGWDFGDHNVSAYRARLERIAAALDLEAKTARDLHSGVGLSID